MEIKVNHEEERNKGGIPHDVVEIEAELTYTNATEILESDGFPMMQIGRNTCWRWPEKQVLTG